MPLSASNGRHKQFIDHSKRIGGFDWIKMLWYIRDRCLLKRWKCSLWHTFSILTIISFIVVPLSLDSIRLLLYLNLQSSRTLWSCVLSRKTSLCRDLEKPLRSYSWYQIAWSLSKEAHPREYKSRHHQAFFHDGVMRSSTNHQGDEPINSKHKNLFWLHFRDIPLIPILHIQRLRGLH